jgi:C4-dicarboxylate-specific signal transduction histidine kinase
MNPQAIPWLEVNGGQDQPTRTVSLEDEGRSRLLELAASIAHEVNQPLCAILSNAQAAQRLLAGGDLNLTEVREALQDVSHDAQRASAIIGRLRSLFAKTPVAHPAVDVNDLIREVAAPMRRDLASRGIALQLALAAKLPAVRGDRVQLQEVIVNLLANGADAMDSVAGKSRELVVRSTADESGGIAVAVTDVGVGLDPANVARLFDAFFTTKPGGMGMGLAICKSIVAAHGGRIWAAPNAAGGATFQLTLPGIREGAS